MRILFLNPLSELGGAERCLLDLQASLSEASQDVEMHLVVGGPGPLVDEARWLGVTVHVVPMPRSLASLGDGSSSARMVIDLLYACAGALRYCRRLRRIVQDIAPDVIHSNGIKSHLAAALANAGVPVVWHIRDLIGRRRLVARALRIVAPRAAGAIAISKLVECDARTVLGRLPIHVVYDAIDTEAFSPDPGDGDALDRAAGFRASADPVVRIGLIATYARWKGQDVFLEAIGRVREPSDGTVVRYFIVGGPIYETRSSQFTEAELRGLADRLGVGDRVGFVPFRNDIVEVYRSLDVVVHASTQPEPFGRTIAEAMACGRAVLMTDVTGAGELAGTACAIRVPPSSVSALAEAMGRLAGDADSREAIGSIGREVAVTRYTRQRLAGEVRQVLDLVVARRPTSRG